MNHYLYLIRYSLPDGKHLMTMNAHPSVAEKDAKIFVGRNPDAKFESFEILQSEQQLLDEIEKIRAENPNRPLANELGLDTPERIMTDPTIARNLAASMAQTGEGAPQPPLIGVNPDAGGVGCC